MSNRRYHGVAEVNAPPVRRGLTEQIVHFMRKWPFGTRFRNHIPPLSSGRAFVMRIREWYPSIWTKLAGIWACTVNVNQPIEHMVAKCLRISDVTLSECMRIFLGYCSCSSNLTIRIVSDKNGYCVSIWPAVVLDRSGSGRRCILKSVEFVLHIWLERGSTFSLVSGRFSYDRPFTLKLNAYLNDCGVINMYCTLLLASL